MSKSEPTPAEKTGLEVDLKDGGGQPIGVTVRLDPSVEKDGADLERLAAKVAGWTKLEVDGEALPKGA
jgi:hypothetical protein